MIDVELLKDEGGHNKVEKVGKKCNEKIVTGEKMGKLFFHFEIFTLNFVCVKVVYLFIGNVYLNCSTKLLKVLLLQNINLRKKRFHVWEISGGVKSKDDLKLSTNYNELI